MVEPPFSSDSHPLPLPSCSLPSPSGAVSEWSGASSTSRACEDRSPPAEDRSPPAEDRSPPAEELSPTGLAAGAVTTHGIQFSKLRAHGAHLKAVPTRSCCSPQRLALLQGLQAERSLRRGTAALPGLQVSGRITAPGHVR